MSVAVQTLVAVVLCMMLVGCHARSSGAPDEACSTIKPNHIDSFTGIPLDFTAGMPYDVTCLRLKWPHNELVQVSVSGAGVGSFGSDLTFRGVLAQIWNPATNTTVGTHQDETKLTKSTCAGGTGATHESSADKTSKFLLFKVGAPQRGTDLECRVTVVQFFNTFYTETLRVA